MLTVHLIDGLPSILELLRVLINILDPNDQAHTDSTRLTALRTLNVAIEVAGTRICDYPSLSVLLLDHGCKYLFQLARSDHPVVLQTALRTIATMFETMRPKLKLQQELFLTFTVDRLAPPPVPATKNLPLAQKVLAGSPRPGSSVPSTPHLGPPPSEFDDKVPATPRLVVPPARGDTRELLLETLCQISRHPSFMVDLYVNYDCDMNCENMFERLIEFSAKVLLRHLEMKHCFTVHLYRESIRSRVLAGKTIIFRTPSSSVWTCFSHSLAGWLPGRKVSVQCNHVDSTKFTHNLP